MINTDKEMRQFDYLIICSTWFSCHVNISPRTKPIGWWYHILLFKCTMTFWRIGKWDEEAGSAEFIYESSEHSVGPTLRVWERSNLPNEYCRRIYWLKLLINLLNSMHDRNFERREPMCIGNFGLTPTKSWGTIQQRKENEMGNLHKDEWGSPLVEFWFEQIGGECTPAHCGSIRAPGFQLFLILVSEHISNNNDNCSNCAQNWLTIDQGAKYYANRLQSTIYLCGCEWHRVLTYQLEQNMLVERYHVQLNTSKTTQDRFDPYIPSYRQGRRGGRFDRVYLLIMGTFCQSRTGSYFDLYILTNYKQLSTITFLSGSKSQAMKSCLL